MTINRFLNKPKKVQSRWYRMRFRHMFVRRFKVFLYYKWHKKLQREFRVKDKIINQSIQKTIREYKKIDETLFPATKQFINIGLYFLLAERDIQAVKADAFFHPNETKRNIAFRTLLLTIYEWDMSKVTGRRMNYIYEATGMSDETKNNLIAALKELRKARKTIEKSFYDIRNNTVAHREPDAMKQYEIIARLNVSDYSSEISAFYHASDKLLNVLVRGMIEIGAISNLIHQVAYVEKNT